MAPLYRLPWQKGLVRLQQRLLATIYPPQCLLCGAEGQLIDGVAIDLCETCGQGLALNEQCCWRCAIPLPSPSEICGQCLKKPPPFDSLYAPFLYQDGIRELLLTLKFNQKLSHARLLGALLSEKLSNHVAQLDELPDAIVPVPLHSKRERQRGFNQALELLRPVARRLQLDINHQLVMRGAATTKQTKLSADERRRNLKGAFSVRKGVAVPRHLVIFDDVVTTTATVTEMAKTLKSAGAKRIDVWAVARVPKPIG
ncbi:MAG: ComF family protein [Gammaproteobacteria bacterium]|nr:ComF family protein [Gammaproteobacteria bacterium]